MHALGKVSANESILHLAPLFSLIQFLAIYQMLFNPKQAQFDKFQATSKSLSTLKV